VVDGSVFHDEKSVLEQSYVLERVAVHGDEVGEVPGRDTADSVTTTPSRAYFSSQARQPVVYALNIHTGRIVWRTQVPPDLYGISDPSVSGNMVVVGSNFAVTALSATGGSQVWRDTFGGGSSCTSAVENWLPAISQGTVYSGTFLDGVVAISLATGDGLWDNKSLTNVPLPLSVTSNTVIAEPLNSSGDNEGLVALNRSDGSILWRQNNSPEAGTATFGRLVWGVASVNARYRQGAAFVATTGQRAGGTPGFPIGEFAGLPPVVSGSQLPNH
jgi:outer membrane protein assembly factor BamB